MFDKNRIPYVAGLAMAILAAVAGYLYGQYNTPEQRVPNLTPTPMPPPCGTPTAHPVAGNLFNGVKLEGDGNPLPSASWTLQPGSGAHTLKVTNHSNQAIPVNLVQLYDNVDNAYRLSGNLPASCNYPTLTNPGCTSLAASGGSCSFTIQTTNYSMTTYLEISTPTGGMMVSIPII